MAEEFKLINGYENYMVSNFGNVKNSKTGRILKLVIIGLEHSRYYAVNLYKDGIRTSKTIHKLVAYAFLQNSENKKCVDHINNDKLNNNLTNLRWATQQENCQNAKFS